MIEKRITIILGAIILSVVSVSALAGSEKNEMVKRGKYIVQISGCNDCHTPGYAQKGGDIPVANWLAGSVVGFAGPWGVTYPKNLRILLADMTEDDWVKNAKSKQSRPPMPWFTLRDMQEQDLRALYQFVLSLGKSGEPAPEYAPPGVTVNTPYIDFVPKNLPAQPDSK